MESFEDKFVKIAKDITAKEMSPICESWLRTFDDENIPALTMQFRGHFNSFMKQIAKDVLETESKMKTRVESE